MAWREIQFGSVAPAMRFYWNGLRRWRDRNWSDRLAVFEAAGALGVARVLIALVPFAALARWIDRRTGEKTASDDDIQRVRFAVEAAARYVPWRSVCLPQALAAWMMLRWRGKAATFHFGVGRDAFDRLIAHAWLEAGNEIVVGGRGTAGVARLASFGALRP